MIPYPRWKMCLLFVVFILMNALWITVLWQMPPG